MDSQDDGKRGEEWESLAVKGSLLHFQTYSLANCRALLPFVLPQCVTLYRVEIERDRRMNAEQTAEEGATLSKSSSNSFSSLRAY